MFFYVSNSLGNVRDEVSNLKTKDGLFNIFIYLILSVNYKEVYPSKSQIP